MRDTFTQNTLSELIQSGLKRDLCVVTGAQGPVITVDGIEVLNFCSNNYLGLASDPRLKQAVEECIKEEGFGSGASRLISGNMAAHQRLEQSLSEFKGTESCLVFSTGYMANTGIISSLFGRDDIIFWDRLNHASIIDGIILSQAKSKRYAHCDMAALEGMLSLHVLIFLNNLTKQVLAAVRQFV